ncbi:hypothetical protein [Aromatoleum anaerobium]|uniref:Uncharacterized protein n=1 Tax=Aromatoleum anaerobium TaxID=182180 RepID=A0ABX1PS98_9RHOO|nr:hypothetical protein [Aromatoleum anaerobium]MCK0509161.1 hypothetical protein [Aromatoleum anaerobium]
MTTKYFLRMFDRLEPRTPWRGGRIVHSDPPVTLDEAAREASKHSGQEVTVADFLRAAARGEIRLRAIVHASAKVQKHDGGIFCNQGQPDENTVPKGAIPTLPLTACGHLAGTGRASWRTFDGFVVRDDLWYIFTEGRLTDDEPDFETVLDDCRVTVYDVHALADAYVDDEGAPADTAPAPPAAEDAQEPSGAPDPWIVRAREHADNIWLRELENNKRPAKESIAPEIASRLWRDDKMVTRRRARITADYIVSHALSPKRNGGWEPPVPE